MQQCWRTALRPPGGDLRLGSRYCELCSRVKSNLYSYVGRLYVKGANRFFSSFDLLGICIVFIHLEGQLSFGEMKSIRYSVLMVHTCVCAPVCMCV